MEESRGWAAVPRNLKSLLVATLLLLTALWLINQPLQTASAPQGVVSFQVAGTADQAHAILLSWQREGETWAKSYLWLSLLFIPVYLITLLRLTGHLMRDRPGVRERTVARWVRALFVAAAITDLAENVLLLNNFNPPNDTVSLWATIFALIKYTGLILGLAGLIIIRAARRHPLEHH
ncbi:hypothetical protein QVZ43_08400 [Marinobacter sp. chi1]|uniref:Transmembrane protein n=1 Tax=Marinobacter suaedae TaxID=3057675 RepID=A0ABT8W0H4_9GAMM|nr:hypothetical protein [Marinobacter sp. chi1]MDO3721745.1 hypothetical protein [Marinobacter sp. chi1]